MEFTESIEYCFLVSVKMKITVIYKFYRLHRIQLGKPEYIAYVQLSTHSVLNTKIKTLQVLKAVVDPGFPRCGRQPQKGTPTCYLSQLFPENCIELGKKWTERGRIP